MSGFKDILKVHKESREPHVEATPPPSPAPEPAVKQDPSPKPDRKPDKSDEPKKRRGRPSGKRSDSEYCQVTAYIRRETHLGVQVLLLQEGKVRDFSELVEELLTKWVKSRT